MVKKAEIGIGTLIIFIAMILVAAIAASVLIQTATSLQNKALLTGNRARDQISSGLEALVVYGTNGTDGDLEEFFLKLKLVAGSETLRFNDTMVEIMTRNTSQNLEYGGTDCSASTGNNTHYFVEYLIESNNHRDDYIHSGEVAMVCANSPYPMGRDEDIEFSIVGTVGFPLVIETALPDYIHTTRVFVFP